jgi:RHS repeat-associated protein
LQGAGGIGGLLAMTESSGTHSYYHADGNGNVTCLINANQLVVAKYLYDPFGNPLSESGSKAFVNPIWFSSQLYDPTTGFLQYLYRVYIPEINRFANQDPIQEAGGINLYEFVGNNPIGNIDYLGEDSGLADPYPWYMLFYGFYGPSFISPPLPGGFVAQAKDRASSIENALMQGVKMKCGQSGTEPVSDSSSPKIGIGSSYTGGWDLNITGNCQWTCEQATKPDCCCNCKIQCNFHGDFSKTWTFQPWGYNPENNLLIWRLVWSYTLTSQLRLYGPLALISPAKYHMEGSFDDSKSLPNKKICEK